MLIADYVNLTCSPLLPCAAFLEKTLDVPIQAWPESDSVPEPLLDRVKQLVLADRTVWKQSIVAFVAFIRAYKEHKLQYVLPFKLLPFGQLATSFALLQMPRVAELRDVRITDFVPTKVDTEKLSYKRPQLEKQRQVKLRTQKQEQSAPQEKRQGNNKRVQPEAEQEQLNDSAESEGSEDDVDDIMEDYRQLKKLKKRKISQREYSRRTGEIDDDS